MVSFLVGRDLRDRRREHVPLAQAACAGAVLIASGFACGQASSVAPAVCSNISGTVESGRLVLRRPELDSVACEEIADPAGAGGNVCKRKERPDWSCVGGKRQASPSVRVTMRGCVVSFGLGATSSGLAVTVLRGRDANGAPTNPGYDLLGPAGGQAEKTGGAVVGRVESARMDPAVCEDEGGYEIAEIPTEVDVIVRISQQNRPKEMRDFVDVYQYNVRLSNGSIVGADGKSVADPLGCTPATCFVEQELNAISTSTIRTIPKTAGVSSVAGERDLFDGQGQGHVAGKVEDCTSSDTIQNAVIAIDAKHTKMTYFNVGFPPDPDRLLDPKPEGTRALTNADGLYAAIGVDTAPGGALAEIGAVVTKSVCGADGVCPCTDAGAKNSAWTAADPGEGETTLLGVRSAFVFPDSVTLLGFDRVTYEVE